MIPERILAPVSYEPGAVLSAGPGPRRFDRSGSRRDLSVNADRRHVVLERQRQRPVAVAEQGDLGAVGSVNRPRRLAAARERRNRDPPEELLDRGPRCRSGRRFGSVVSSAGSGSNRCRGWRSCSECAARRVVGDGGRGRRGFVGRRIRSATARMSGSGSGALGARQQRRTGPPRCAGPRPVTRRVKL